MTTLIISDTHLGARNSRTDLLSALLRSDFERLILNGDIVNSLNFERFRRCDWRIVDLLKTIAKERELILIRGNHDGQLDDDPEAGFGSLGVLADLLGTEMVEEYELPTADGTYLVLHGDRFDATMNLTWVGTTADWCYNGIQTLSRPTAGWLKGRVKHWCGVVASVKRYALPYARKRGCTGVICGHTHYCDDEWVDGMRYLNTGCWVDSPCTYVRVEDGYARLATWTDEPMCQPAYAMELTNPGLTPVHPQV